MGVLVSRIHRILNMPVKKILLHLFPSTLNESSRAKEANSIRRSMSNRSPVSSPQGPQTKHKRQTPDKRAGPSQDSMVKLSTEGENCNAKWRRNPGFRFTLHFRRGLCESEDSQGTLE